MELKRPQLYLIVASVTGLVLLFFCFKSCPSKDPLRWTMVTTWSDDLPILTESLKKMAVEINEQTKGEFQITVFSSREFKKKGRSVPPDSALFNAVSRNEAQMIHSAAYYWKHIPGAAFFSAVPFGMNYHEMNSWIHDGDGLILWRELYRPYNMLPFPCGHTHEQMGGWFKFIADSSYQFKGKTIRIAGLGGEVLKKLGDVRVIPFPQDEIYSRLDRGPLNAAEWIGPYHDYIMKLHLVSDYYYEPGWQEYNTMFEMVINQTAWNQLPTPYRQLLEDKIKIYDAAISREFKRKNEDYLIILKNEGVRIRQFSNELLTKLSAKNKIVIDSCIKSDATRRTGNIAKSYYDFSLFKTRRKQNRFLN